MTERTLERGVCKRERLGGEKKKKRETKQGGEKTETESRGRLREK